MADTIGIESSICRLKKILKIIGGKWKVSIICSIYSSGTIRYGELKRKIDGITNTMLASSLRELEKDGLIIRKQYDEMPVRVEYELTPRCKTLIPILFELNSWVEENIK